MKTTKINWAWFLFDIFVVSVVFLFGKPSYVNELFLIVNAIFIGMYIRDMQNTREEIED